ncbi:MAG TPA: NAD(P)-dependent oxidoreductase [Candidatus Limnocylindria bacterium]|nr:NAD(P)-dependent oxidoreductase [Candidatus Limnocylindria bacterium]
MTGSAVVLVTGGHGVIGSWVCRELVRRDARVIVFDTRGTPSVVFPESAAVDTIVGDLRDAGSLRAAIADRGVERVVHLAAIIGDKAEQDPALAIEVNALATARLLALAADRKMRRVIAMSTKGVLGKLAARYLRPTYDPVPIDLPAQPSDVYASTKAVVEALVAAHRSRGLAAAAVRLATTWGPGKTGESHAGFSLHSDIVTRAARGEPSRLDTRPDEGYDLIYYGDVAAGLAGACLSDGEPGSPVYHLGSGVITTLGEFAAAVRHAFPGASIELGDQPAGGRNCLLDIGPARRDFGYEPAFAVQRALEDFARHLHVVVAH